MQLEMNSGYQKFGLSSNTSTELVKPSATNKPLVVFVENLGCHNISTWVSTACISFNCISPISSRGNASQQSVSSSSRKCMKTRDSLMQTKMSPRDQFLKDFDSYHLKKLRAWLGSE